MRGEIARKRLSVTGPNSGVSRVARRLDLREPACVEKDEPLRLLLVEDNDDDAELVVMELRRAGYVPEVHRVDSGPRFVAALEAGGWDAIVSDHTLPAYGGLHALADLRASGLDIPFILVSGTSRRSIGRGRPREDGLPRKREPRISDAAHPGARADRRRARRARSTAPAGTARAAFPDLWIRVRSLMATAETAIAELKMEGTQSRDFLGVLNQEKHVDVDQAWMLWAWGGRITGIRAYWCQNQLYRRLAVKRLDRISILR